MATLPVLEFANDLTLGLGDQRGLGEIVDAGVDEPHGSVTHQEIATAGVEGKKTAIAAEIVAIHPARATGRVVRTVVGRSIKPVLAVQKVSPSAAIRRAESLDGARSLNPAFVVDRRPPRSLADQERVRSAVPDIGDPTPLIDV